MTKQELFLKMNELCQHVKIKDDDIEAILKIRQIKNLDKITKSKAKKKAYFFIAKIKRCI